MSDSDASSSDSTSSLPTRIKNTARRVIPGAESPTPTTGTPPDQIPSTFNKLKRFIASSGITWKSRGAQLGELHSRTYVVTGWPKEAQAHFLYHLYADSSIYYNCSLHYEPYEKGEAVEILDDIETQLADKTHGELAEYIPNVESLEETRHIVKETKRAIENDGETLFDISISVTAYAAQEQNLEAFDSRIRELLEVEANMELLVPEDYPDLAHISSSPLGKPALKERRETASQLALGETVGATFPFIEDTFTEPEGIVYGLNTANGTGVMVDIFNRNNGYNKLVIGDIGSGKSFSTGTYLLRHYVMNPDDNIVIIDPMGGFVGVTYALDGERIIVNGSETINPLQIEAHNNTDAIEGDPYKTKLDDVRWFFNRFFNEYSTDGLSAAERAPLDRAIRGAYQQKGITSDPETHSNESPTINDVMDVLEDIADNPKEYAASTSMKEVSRWEEAAANLLMAMEPFREGNELHNLVGQTDFEITPERPTYIDMSQLDGKEDLGLMMKIVFSMIYEQVKNYDGRSIICMDEAHKIIDDPEEANHWEELFRHSRHHDLSIWLLSQEFEDFFKSEDGEGANEAAKTMASLCMVQQIHRVSNVNRKLAKDGLNLTDDHIDYVESAIPGEAGEGYTTALLNINDAGYLGLKVIATQNEAALVDYDPSQEWGDGENENTLPESGQIKRAVDIRNKLTGTRPTEIKQQEQPEQLEASGEDTSETRPPQIKAASDGSGAQLPDIGDDPLIQDLMDEIPLEHFHHQVKERIATKLIDDPSTPYAPEQKDLIISALATREGLGQLHKPEVIDAPQEDGTVQITINQPEVSQSKTETLINESDQSSPDSDSPSESEPTSNETSPWVFSNPSEEAAATGGETADSRPEINWHARVEEHTETIQRLGQEEIKNMAEILSLEDQSLQHLPQQIAEEHARREVTGTGKTAPIGPIKEITRTLTWGVEELLNDSLTGNTSPTEPQTEPSIGQDNDKLHSSPDSADSTADKTDTDAHDNTVPYSARKRAHTDALKDLPTDKVKTIANGLDFNPALYTDQDKLLSAIASIHSQREITDNGMKARVQPSTQIDRSNAIATSTGDASSNTLTSDTDPQSENNSTPASIPTVTPTDDRHFDPLPDTTTPPSFADRKATHQTVIEQLTPRHRALIVDELSLTAPADNLSEPQRTDQIATAHALLEINAGDEETTHRATPEKRIKESTPLPPINFPTRKQRYTDALATQPKETLLTLYKSQFGTTPPTTATPESIASDLAIQVARKEIQTGTATAPVALEDHFPQITDNE